MKETFRLDLVLGDFDDAALPSTWSHGGGLRVTVRDREVFDVMKKGIEEMVRSKNMGLLIPWGGGDISQYKDALPDRKTVLENASIKIFMASERE